MPGAGTGARAQESQEGRNTQESQKNRSNIVITHLTDPMMGLSWECEPALRKVETHFPGTVRIQSTMGLLVRDVSDFMTPAELALDPEEGVPAYNERLAGIYRQEEPIAGMPINMEGFCLFSPEHRSSRPLNLAYEAVRLISPDRAEQFLYRLRFATVVQCRPTTRTEELVDVARACGLDTDAFLHALSGQAAQKGLEASTRCRHRLGVRSLPAFLVSLENPNTPGRPGVLLGGVVGYETLVAAIAKVTGSRLRPQEVRPSPEALSSILETHPLVSSVEIREAFELGSESEARRLCAPLLESGRAVVASTPRGWFLEAAAPCD